MKSLRLNKELRESIVNAVMEKWDKVNKEPTLTFPERKHVSIKAANAIWDKIYAKDVEGVREDLLNKSRALKVQFPDGDISDLVYGYDKEGYLIWRPATIESKVEYCFSKEDPIYKDYKKDLEVYKSELEVYNDFKKTRKDYAASVRQVVEGVNTTNQLLEVWPEVEQFIPNNLNNPSSIKLPSVNINELNNQLGE